MYKPQTFEEKMRHREVRMRLLELLTPETRFFYLECRLRRLESAWPGSTGDAQRRLPRERILVRHEFEMLKIDIETLERGPGRSGNLAANNPPTRYAPLVCYNQVLELFP